MVRDVSVAPGELPQAPGEPELVYHYTDTVGLLGIVTNKVLWASDVWFMNDAGEALYGIELIERVLDSLEPGSGAAGNARDRAQSLLETIKRQEGFWRSYIACLSFVGDDLSQWRAYGRPRGFSIGFDTAKLRAVCSLVPELGKPTFRYVTYDEVEQGNGIKMRFNSAVDRLPVAPTEDELRTVIFAFVTGALQLAPAFKHPAFKNEREVRLHVYRSADATDGLRFRPGALGIVPYVEIDLKDPGTKQMTLIREVIIGPQPNELESQRSVKRFLAHHGLQHVEVRLSRVPLRPR